MKTQEIPVGTKVRWANGMGHENNGCIDERPIIKNGIVVGREKIIRSFCINKPEFVPIPLMVLLNNQTFEVIEPIYINKDEFKKKLKEELDILHGAHTWLKVVDVMTEKLLS